LVRYQENEGIVLKLVPNVSSKLSKEFSESKVEMIGLFDITEGTFNQPIQTCNTRGYF
jgi:hypothetical protein